MNEINYLSNGDINLLQGIVFFIILVFNLSLILGCINIYISSLDYAVVKAKKSLEENGICNITEEEIKKRLISLKELGVDPTTIKIIIIKDDYCVYYKNNRYYYFCKFDIKVIGDKFEIIDNINERADKMEMENKGL